MDSLRKKIILNQSLYSNVKRLENYEMGYVFFIKNSPAPIFCSGMILEFLGIHTINYEIKLHKIK